MLRSLLCLVLFTASFLAVRQGIESLAPERLKVAWLESQKDEVDALFVGSSRVHRQIDPARCDQRMAEAGQPVRSLNLGMQGMHFGETLYLTERILDMAPARLRYLLLELSALETAIEDENRLTERVVSWHSWPVTWRLCLTVAAEDLPLSEKLRRIEDHWVHWGHRFGNLGRGREALDVLLHGPDTDFSGRHNLGPAEDGFRSLDDERGANFQQRRQLFMRDLQKFRDAKQALLEPDGDQAADPALIPALERIHRLCAEHGVTPIYLILPVIEKQTALARLHEAGAARWMIRFDDPANWPQFYRAKNRFDIHHLDGNGARLMTDALAAELLALDLGLEQD